MGAKENMIAASRMVQRMVGMPTLSDPDSVAAVDLTKKEQRVSYVIGTVTRTGCGSYDCEVTVNGVAEYLCNVAVPAISNTFGYSMCSMPEEGSRVLVLVDSRVSKIGFIVGIAPPYDGTVPEGYATEDNPIRASRIAPDSLVGHEFTAAYKVPLEDKTYAQTLDANSLRPLDIIQGEFALVNENSCGIVCSMFSSAITSGLAYVKACRFDDTVRVVCRTFQQYTTQGSYVVYNDSGYITSESKVSIYQGERLGISKLNGETFDKDEKREKDGVFYLQNKVKRQTAAERIKSFVGFLGGLISKFVLKPEKTTEARGMDDKPKDTGLTQLNVDGSGRVQLRTAGGIALQRYDAIPVPFRQHDPWDTDGDTPEFTTIKPFTWDSDSRLDSVQLTDSLAWELGQTYSRFDQLKKDFYTPEEEELKAQETKWDDIDSSETVDLAKNNGKRCGVFMQPNGSIIIRDNWGSEIVMAGGDVTISAKGDIKVVSAKTIAALGKDVAIDANDGIDMSCSNLFASSLTNAHIMAEGILLESTAESVMEWEKPKSGSDTKSYGVLIQTPKSGFVVNSSRLNMTVDEDAFLVAQKIQTDCDTLALYGSSVDVVATDDTRILTSSFNIYCEPFTLVSDSFTAYQGGEVMTPIWSSAKAPKAPDPSEEYDTNTSDDTKKPYTDENLEQYVFSYRSSTQSNTNDTIFVNPAWNKTYWSADTKNKDISFGKWDPFIVKDVPSEYSMSWPGRDTFEGTNLSIVEDKNMTDHNAGGSDTASKIDTTRSKKRDRLVDYSAIERKSLDSFVRYIDKKS